MEAVDEQNSGAFSLPDAKAELMFFAMVQA